MKPGARMASAMEALEEMEANWAEGGRAPADAVLNQYFRQRRFIGSKDRGEISRVVYAVLRNEAALNWQLNQGGLPADPRGRVLAEAVLFGGAGLEDMKALCDGHQYCPPRLSEPELGWIKQQARQPLLTDAMPPAVRYHFPEWLTPRLESVFREIYAFSNRSDHSESPSSEC